MKPFLKLRDDLPVGRELDTWASWAVSTSSILTYAQGIEHLLGIKIKSYRHGAPCASDEDVVWLNCDPKCSPYEWLCARGECLHESAHICFGTVKHMVKHEWVKKMANEPTAIKINPLAPRLERVAHMAINVVVDIQDETRLCELYPSTAPALLGHNLITGLSIYNKLCAEGKIGDGANPFTWQEALVSVVLLARLGAKSNWVIAGVNIETGTLLHSVARGFPSNMRSHLMASMLRNNHRTKMLAIGNRCREARVTTSFRSPSAWGSIYGRSLGLFKLVLSEITSVPQAQGVASSPSGGEEGEEGEEAAKGNDKGNDKGKGKPQNPPPKSGKKQESDSGGESDLMRIEREESNRQQTRKARKDMGVDGNRSDALPAHYFNYPVYRASLRALKEAVSTMMETERAEVQAGMSDKGRHLNKRWAHLFLDGQVYQRLELDDGEELHLALVLDRSGSMSGSRLAHAAALTKAFAEVLMSAGCNVACWLFCDSTVRRLPQFLDRATGGGGGTLGAPSITLCRRWMRQFVSGRKMCIYITDGQLADKERALKQMLLAQSEGIEFIIIGIDLPAEKIRRGWDPRLAIMPLPLDTTNPGMLGTLFVRAIRRLRSTTRRA